MKTKYLITNLLMFTIILAGCGRNRPRPNNFGVNNFNNISALCQPTNEPPMRATGIIGNGGTITVDFTPCGGGTYRAVGELNITSMKNLYGYTSANVQENGFRTNLSGQGSISSGAYDNVKMTLKGDNNVTVVFGTAAWAGIDTYISEIKNGTTRVLAGNIWISVPGQAELTGFIMPAE